MSTKTNKWSVVNYDLDVLEEWEDIPEEFNGYHSYLVEYYKKCRSGDIVIGRELATTLEVLIQMLIDPPTNIKFNIKPAHTRIRFIEKEVKHFEAPFAGKPFILSINQKAIIEALFGFFYFDEELLGGGKWVRLFKEFLLVIARKNGKTPFAAAIVLAEWFCGEAGQKIMCASNDYEQASLVFDCINNFREESRAMSKVTRKNVKGIFFGNYSQRKTTGKFSCQNKGTIKKMSARSGAKEGRNLKTVIVDEVHEMADRTTVMPLRSSLTTQEEPLYIEITTEGVVRDGYLDERLVEARSVLKGEMERPRWLIWLYTQDSEEEVWNDEGSWYKSNPMLNVVKKISDLRDLVEEARINGSQRAFTMAKEFNIKQLSARAWLNESDIIANNGSFTLEEFRNNYCVIGVDLAETNDLCAVSFLFMKKNSPIKYFYTMYFVTETKAGDKSATDSPTNVEKKNYLEWEKEGLCRIVSGNIIDDGIVADYIYDMCKNYGIRPTKIGYDEWHAKEFTRIIKQRFDLKGEILTKIRMSYDALNTPTRTLEADLLSRHICYNNNAICKWCFRNTAVKHDDKGFVMPEKIAGYVGNKIDGTVTKIIAYAALRECKTAFMARLV